MLGIGNRKSQHSFAQQPSVHMARSAFDRSFGVKDTFDFDQLVPIFVDEILPGDTCNVSLNAFARLATQKVPIMDNMYVDYFFFFVPNRLVWNHWEQFNGAQENPDDTTDYILPQITAPAVTGFEVGSIYDKMGLPTGVPNLVVNNALPIRCYALIWNQWFRDQNLQDSILVNKDDGPDAPSDVVLQYRGKRHDYFTSALPWPQKGDAVTLPLGSTAPVLGLGKINGNFPEASVGVRESNGSTATYAHAAYFSFGGGGDGNYAVNGTAATSGYPQIYADLTAASAATINQLREAFMMQSLLELDARGGTRYTEILQAHFNVTSPDFRLQRAEFLGGGSSRIQSHAVPQTSPTSGGNVQAQLASYATMGTGGVGFSKSFVEHGYVIGMACARADITYQQGMNRMWNRSTRYDFFWPKLQELGEQAILNKEIYAQGTSADENVFGYQERYAEYRYKPSEIHGAFRSTYATTLDYWHLAEEFGSLPALNDTFIKQSTPIERALSVTDEPHLIVDMFFNYRHVRPMATYSVPATLGRF